MAIQRITVIGTGLIGASVGLALRATGFAGEIAGWDRSPEDLETAAWRGAISRAAENVESAYELCESSDVIVLATPVFGIRAWMEELAPRLHSGQLVTDVGSTKADITHAAKQLFSREDGAFFLPGHPMAGKEAGGALLAEANLFRGAVWLFTSTEKNEPEIAQQWRNCVLSFGSRVMDIDAARHDELCAWVSHLPQMLSTAFSALLEDTFSDAPDLRAIGGRALRETTRLGSSPYSMWRDIAASNAGPIGAALLALEQRLAHVRENLMTPELREEFEKANQFRGAQADAGKK
jgi:prephenate dehydrogenase